MTQELGGGSESTSIERTSRIKLLEDEIFSSCVRMISVRMARILSEGYIVVVDPFFNVVDNKNTKAVLKKLKKPNDEFSSFRFYEMVIADYLNHGVGMVGVHKEGSKITLDYLKSVVVNGCLLYTSPSPRD